MSGAISDDLSGRLRFPEIFALRRVFASRWYLVTYAALAPPIGFAYALLLPGLIFGSYGLWVLRFLTPTEGAFALAMAVLLPLVLVLNVYLVRHPECRPAKRAGAGAPLGALLLSVIPNALCCTPIVPVLLAAFVSGAALVSISAPVQYFLGTYSALLYAVSALALWGSIRVASRRLTCAPGPSGDDTVGTVTGWEEPTPGETE